MDIKRAIQEGSLKFLYPNSTFAWILSGAKPENMVRNIRSLVSRDLLTLGALALRQQTRATAIVLYTDPILEYVAPIVKMLQAWNIIVIGSPELQLPNPAKFAANTCDIILVYGEPTKEVYDNDKPILERTIEKPGIESAPLTCNKDPYSQYRHVVDQLQNWSRIAPQGLQTRDFIAVRPQPRTTLEN